MRRAIIFCLLFTSISLYAADEPLRFEDPDKQQQYQHLLDELRCLVCQNQTLADSHAELAQDLRNEVYKMVEAGQSDEGIIEFLVSRYGDFVLYRPPVKSSTVMLWFGPFVLLLVGLFSVYRFVRSRNTAAVDISLADRERVASLFNNSSDNQKS